MIAAIIPYFLVCNISVPESAWPNGPEYVYRGQGNFSIKWDPNIPPKLVSYNTSIYCRPKNVGTLSCIFENLTMYGDDDGTELNRNLMTPQRFEVGFNELGAENITVPNGMDMLAKSFVKLFATQFTVGADLSGKTDQDGVFEVMNSTVEEYKMNVEIGYTPEPEYNKTNNLYQLELLPQINVPIGKAIEIKKQKLVPADGIRRTIEIPFSPPGNSTISLFQRTDWSKDHMKISKHTFKSSTNEKSMMSSIELEAKTVSVGFVEITLMDVKPANEPIPAVEDPTTYIMIQQDIIDQYFLT